MAAYEYEYNGRTFLVYKSTQSKRWWARLDGFNGQLVQTVEPCASRKDAIKAAQNYIDALFTED